MRTQEIKSGDWMFDDQGNYYGRVQRGLTFRGDFVKIAIHNNHVPFRDAFSDSERAVPVTLNRATIFASGIPGVWKIEHRLDLNQRVERERLEFALYDTFNLMG